MAKQTPIQEFIQLVKNDGNYEDFTRYFKYAIIDVYEKEKEEIKSAFNQGYRDAENDCCESVGTDVAECANAENYYNDTYGTE